MTNSIIPPKVSFRIISLLVSALLVSILFVDMVQPYLVALGLAAIATAMSAKLQTRMMGVTGGRESLAKGSSAVI